MAWATGLARAAAQNCGLSGARRTEAARWTLLSLTGRTRLRQPSEAGKYGSRSEGNVVLTVATGIGERSDAFGRRDDARGSSARARRLHRLCGAILFETGQIALDTALYLSVVGSLLFVLLVVVGRL